MELDISLFLCYKDIAPMGLDEDNALSLRLLVYSMES
jgi:hypothetical protein